MLHVGNTSIVKLSVFGIYLVDFFWLICMRIQYKNLKQLKIDYRVTFTCQSDAKALEISCKLYKLLL